MKPKHLIYVLLPVSALGAMYLGAPSAIRWYVEDTYPGVHAQQIDPSWDGVTFRDVGVQRPGITARLDRVFVSWDRQAQIEGGEVALEMKGAVGRPERPSTGLSIVAKGLKVSVTKGSLEARLEGASVDSKKVCFERGDVTRKGLSVEALRGCVQRDQSSAQADEIRIPVRIPFEIPRVNSEQTVSVDHPKVLIEDRILKFRSATLGPFVVEGPATVNLSEDPEGSVVLFDAPRISVNHPWVSPNTAFFRDVSVTAPLTVIQTGQGTLMVRAGGASVRIDPENFSIEGDETCGDWLDILPHPLPPVLKGMKENFSGRMRFEVRTTPIPHLDIHHTCSYTCSEEPIKELREGNVTYQAYGSDGELFDRSVGPYKEGWVSIGDMSPHIPRAFVLMEDPGFYSHTGILPEALENSLKANLASGEFVKGGSTITMQLAKNLWLRRHKTIGRKVYEALLTVAVESCLSKANILEWYMNVVEYGPDLYGIGPATKHYFHKPAQQIELDEAFYLASLLPSPRKALPPDQGGLEKAHRLMERLANSGVITEYLLPSKEDGTLDTHDWQVNE